MLLLTPTKTDAANFSKLYVFGDSLSDTGNAFNTTGLPLSPYDRGRFSNGSIWIDDLGRDLRLNPVLYTAIVTRSAAPTQGINFAFGGATTGTSNTASSSLPGLQQQIDSFSQLIPAGQSADPKALYIVWAGANDYLGGRLTDPSIPLANLSKAIEELTTLGARNILVANLPNLGLLPATRNAPNAAVLERVTARHNAGLGNLVDELTSQADTAMGARSEARGSARSETIELELNIKVLDVNALFRQAVDGELEFTNVSEACFNRSTGTICADPSRSLFWDGIHPTAAAHRRLEETAIALLQPSPKPQAVKPMIGFSVVVGLIFGLGSIVKYRWQKVS